MLKNPADAKEKTPKLTSKVKIAESSAGLLKVLLVESFSYVHWCKLVGNLAQSHWLFGLLGKGTF